MIDLAAAKQQLRITGSQQDSLIALYIAAAYAHIESWCDKKFAGEYPPDIDLAALLLVGGSDLNREAEAAHVLEENPALYRLLQPHRRYGFGPVDAFEPTLDIDEQGLLIGDTFSRDWQWLDSTGAPINVSGYTAAFTLGVTEYQATILNAAEGRFSVTLSATQTNKLAAVKTLYTLKVTSPAGVVTTLDRKTVSIQ